MLDDLKMLTLTKYMTLSHEFNPKNKKYTIS